MFVLEGLEVKTILKYAIHSYRQCPPKENKGKTSSTNHKVSAMCAHFRELAKNWSYRSHLVYHSKVKVILLIMELDIQISSKENLSCVYTFFFFSKNKQGYEGCNYSNWTNLIFFQTHYIVNTFTIKENLCFCCCSNFSVQKETS